MNLEDCKWIQFFFFSRYYLRMLRNSFVFPQGDRRSSKRWSSLCQTNIAANLPTNKCHQKGGISRIQTSLWHQKMLSALHTRFKTMDVENQDCEYIFQTITCLVTATVKVGCCLQSKISICVFKETLYIVFFIF